ncbi:Imm49 family immunity protein [Williamsia sp. CHRR-6]|uniref:Imm49 family immunity protein n=1 Tax=Williamsia sp. CHRR-6 TaxID=2835871 RepID=UPI001BDB4A9C|nr:Imm49 family immunity protein [Williamsia sp. CHRR-6]MBT0568502.1 immunity 49 family protein [Williamsia sp. CHRR-6]
MIPVRVDRHELELDVAAELEAARADFFAHARAVGEGASVTETITLGERLLCLLLVSDPGAYSDATVEAGEDLTFLYSALFNTRLPGGEPVDPPIANYCSVIPYTGTTEVHTVEAWTRLFWWSQLSWNGYATEAMRSIMTHPLPSAPHPHRDTFREMLLTAVGDRPWVDGLMKASAAMPDDEEATAGDESVAEQVWLLERPLINMLVAAWNSDEADLARDTGAALAAHRSYWTATAERRRDPRGMFALPVAAVAAMVRRSGLGVVPVNESNRF